MLDGIVQSSTATPLASSLGISMTDARRTPLVTTRSDASFSGNLIGQNSSVLQCQAFRLNVPDHLSSPIKNGGRKWTGDETMAGCGDYRVLQNGCCKCHSTCDSPLNFDLTLVSLYSVGNRQKWVQSSELSHETLCHS